MFDVLFLSSIESFVMNFVLNFVFLLDTLCTYPSVDEELEDRINSNEIAQALAQEAIKKKASQRDKIAKRISENAKELAFAGEIAKDD